MLFVMAHSPNGGAPQHTRGVALRPSHAHPIRRCSLLPRYFDATLMDSAGGRQRSTACRTVQNIFAATACHLADPLASLFAITHLITSSLSGVVLSRWKVLIGVKENVSGGWYTGGEQAARCSHHCERAQCWFQVHCSVLPPYSAPLLVQPCASKVLRRLWRRISRLLIPDAERVSSIVMTASCKAGVIRLRPAAMWCAEPARTSCATRQPLPLTALPMLPSHHTLYMIPQRTGPIPQPPAHQLNAGLC